MVDFTGPAWQPTRTETEKISIQPPPTANVRERLDRSNQTTARVAPRPLSSTPHHSGTQNTGDARHPLSYSAAKAKPAAWNNWTDVTTLQRPVLEPSSPSASVGRRSRLYEPRHPPSTKVDTNTTPRLHTPVATGVASAGVPGVALQPSSGYRTPIVAIDPEPTPPRHAIQPLQRGGIPVGADGVTYVTGTQHVSHRPMMVKESEQTRPHTPHLRSSPLELPRGGFAGVTQTTLPGICAPLVTMDKQRVLRPTSPPTLPLSTVVCQSPDPPLPAPPRSPRSPRPVNLNYLP